MMNKIFHKGQKICYLEFFFSFIAIYIYLSFFREDDFEDLEAKNEDDMEEAEMRLLQRQLDQGQHVTESQEEKDYKAEFFELLDEVK